MDYDQTNQLLTVLDRIAKALEQISYHITEQENS